MSERPEDDHLDDCVFDDDEPDDDDLYDECGMMPDGQCMQAGSEWCDWECPVMAMRARSRIAAMKKAQHRERGNGMARVFVTLPEWLAIDAGIV